MIVTAPSAVRALQLSEGPLDDALTTHARALRPGVKHWWGRRWQGNRHGALCYLCGGMIAEYSHRWPITEQARAQIDLHRKDHIRALLGGAATEEVNT